MITTMRGSLMEGIPMTNAQFGLLTSVFSWVYGLLSPLGGYLADRFNRSKVIVTSLFAWSLFTWLTAHATTFNQLLATRALMGISEACYLPAALALIADYHRGPTRSFATGVHMTGLMVGAGLGGLGGWIAERQGWSHAFSIFGLIGIVYAVVTGFLLRDVPPEPATKIENTPVVPPAQVRLGTAILSLLTQRGFLMALAFWSLLNLGAAAISAWMPTYLNEQFHLSQGTAGLSATGYLAAASLVGMLVGGGWADRWARTNERGRTYVPVIGLFIAGPGILLAAGTNWLPVAVLGLILYGLARAFCDSNMMPILCTVADPRYRATGYGILNFCGNILGGFTIYFGGLMRDAGVNISVLFQIGAGFVILAAVVLLCTKPRIRPETA
ncbi:MAG: MFS transporter [Opitutus sp.]|nr:MFS transporter [Opitutus sp.]